MMLKKLLRTETQLKYLTQHKKLASWIVHDKRLYIAWRVDELQYLNIDVSLHISLPKSHGHVSLSVNVGYLSCLKENKKHKSIVLFRMGHDFFRKPLY